MVSTNWLILQHGRETGGHKNYNSTVCHSFGLSLTITVFYSFSTQPKKSCHKEVTPSASVSVRPFADSAESRTRKSGGPSATAREGGTDEGARALGYPRGAKGGAAGGRPLRLSLPLPLTSHCCTLVRHE